MKNIIVMALFFIASLSRSNACFAEEVCSKIGKICFVTMEDCRAVGGHRAYSSASPTGHDCHHEKINKDGSTTYEKYSGDALSEDPQREADEIDAILSRADGRPAGA